MLGSKDRRRDITGKQDLSPKIIQAGEQWDGQPYVAATQEALVLAGSVANGIISDARYGTTVHGPFSISEMPEQVSFAGGFWRINPAVLTSVGSSAAMNIPWLVHDEPELLKTRHDLASLNDNFGVL